MAKVIECYLDDFASIDQDYEGQKFYHIGEQVKIVNPDHEHFKDTGIYRGYKRQDYPGPAIYPEPDIYLIEIKEDDEDEKV